jgi:bifunctional UDP-N-acetylglucosamine pyrophosphorylase/glucosamine-1-phosphate N-acetyltransferase
VRDESGSVVRIVEHRDATEAERAIGEVNTSLYVFDGDFLFGSDGVGGAIAQLKTDNDQGEYLLTDVVAQAAQDGQSVRSFLIDDSVQVAGVNDRRQLAALEAALRERVNDRWMLDGVSMSDPSSTRIEEGVQLAPDVRLGAGVDLRGDTQLDSGVEVGPGCILTDSTVAADATLSAYVVLTGARVEAGACVLPFTLVQGLNEKQPDQTAEADRVRLGAGARVGPFSHLRQASDVGASAHVGNFVELKKTRLAQGAKANHLAYLGDADVGARSNIGAGVITCNYDGFAKHKTVIGEDAFVGTDSHLIAPVRLGKGAYVATGTTVTRDVPADAFAIGRARQENKAGYASRIKKHLQHRAESAKARASERPAAPPSPDNDST